MPNESSGESSDRQRSRVRDLITGAWATQVIHHGVQLGVFDAMAQGPISSRDFAASTDNSADGVFRLLRAVATLGLARQVENDVFTLTDEGRLLCSDTAGSLRGVALHWGGRIWNSFQTLGVAVHSGKASVSSGADDFVAMQNDPVRSAVFNRAMAEQSLAIGREVAQAYDFSIFETVMDVGGGYGAVLRALLEKYENLHGSVMDLPALAAQATAYLEEAGVAERARYIGGDFFVSVPPADAFILKYIIHDWNDENALRILRNCRRAAGKSGSVLLLEQVVPQRVSNIPTDQAAIRADLIMMTVGGKERTEAEYRALCAAAGLRIDRIVAMPSGFSLIETKSAGPANRA
jgi:hypothetical protein